MAMLGFLVMSGIVTDNNGEVAVNKNVDAENVKETITNVLTQISTTLETGVLGLVKQVENIKSETSDKIENQSINKPIVEAVQPVKEETKPAEMIDEKPQVIEPVRVENQMSIEAIFPIQEAESKHIEIAKADEQNSL